ncbi:hypothetical protein [Pseudofrankia sp. BMG5.37]|uniref:hypothetical protein n=1 Tax=Pseudofrankia sp. BMG5.37 TaxID=3050035 RepID=UPI0018E321EC|nr:MULTISPECIES: hypothetical protein [unclassified Pseudofrankia]MDT3446461.1 hypothetical protein [Pseudofrankia sp. BMG5.37]
MEADSVRLRLRRVDGVRKVDLDRWVPVGFDGVLPWRTFRWRGGQAHYSGLYWSAVMGGHVGYESRLELAWLLMADRDSRPRLRAGPGRAYKGSHVHP